MVPPLVSDLWLYRHSINKVSDKASIKGSAKASGLFSETRLLPGGFIDSRTHGLVGI
ncbi:MAG: hypothetical protein L0K41_07310 [Yaniella sp.]|nr:hypothetical protein [Yaniella sp.]MDN6534227.1 hypothetical protein [Yaniella sp.]